MIEITKTLSSIKFLARIAGINFRKRWEFVKKNEYGGDIYKKGNKLMLIFPYRIFMWEIGKDAIIREINK